MVKKFLIIFIFISMHSLPCFPQQVTFEKVLSRITYCDFKPLSIFEYSGRYIYAGLNEYDSSSIVFSTDLNGKVLWEKRYTGNYISVVKGLNKITAFITEYPFLRICELNLNGDETRIKIVEDSLKEHQAVSDEQSFYIIGEEINNNIYIVELQKINYNFEKLWSKKDTLSQYTISQYTTSLRKSFQKGHDGYLYYSFYVGIAKFDPNGVLLKLYDYPVAGLIISSNGSIIIYSSHNISFLSSDGEVKLLTEISGDWIGNCSFTSDNGVIVSTINKNIIKLDSLGNILWSKKLRESAQLCFQTSNNGFLFCGKFSKGPYPDLFPYHIHPWVVKTGLDGSYNSINVYYPEGNNLPYYFDEVRADFITNSQYVNFYISYDNKATWELIISNLQANSGYIKWKPHFNTADNCYLKIVSSHDPSLFDESDTSFSIIIYHEYDYIAANEIKMWAGNNGSGSNNPSTNGSGLLWPGGEKASVSSVFSDGLVWGGKVSSEVRFNGNSYRAGLSPGRILENNIPDYSVNTKNRLFKIKKNWEFLPDGEEKEIIKAAVEDWPGEYGAPYKDTDNNGTFSTGIDAPAYIGDELLFYIANDLDEKRTMYTYGSLPIGLEFQTTIWAYDSSNYLKDVVFKRYLVINKGENTVDSMYFGYWSDDDLGLADDDVAGCDSNLNIGFIYNGDNNDDGYQGYGYGLNPPAVAHMFLQGPIIPSEKNDSAKIKNKWRKGFKNLDIAAFFVFPKVPPYNDPVPGRYSSSIEFYNILQGLLPTGDKIINPRTNEPTTFCLSGDPEKGEGWYEGPGWPGGPIPYDRRSVVSTGPFTFAPGDTQEVVIAIFMAQGTNNLNSVTELKRTAAKLQEFWKNLDMDYSEGQIIPDGYILYQNYPNPFNPATTIRYELPEWSNVELKVYDVLGREVITLINKEQPAGKYKVEMNSGIVGNGLASGVYIYRLITNNYVSSKKMLLIK